MNADMNSKVDVIEDDVFFPSVKSKQAKTKVLFVIDTLQLGGAEQSLLENTTNFKFIQPVICHVYPGEILKQKFIDKDVQVYSLDVKKKYGFVEAYQKLKKIIKDEKPDLIVAYLTRSEIVSRLAGKFNNIPVLGTFVNDLYCAPYNQHLSKKAKLVVQFFKLINKLTTRFCIGFVSNSQHIKEANAQHLDVPLSKIKVINRGRNSSQIIKKQPGPINRKEIHFVNVSRLFAVKAHTNLILGFKKFTTHFSNATLDIVGDGPLRDELQQLIDKNNLQDKVKLLGARKDVPSLLHDYDCFVFPSLVEGFSGAVVEAMFANVPVLVSDIPQNQEAIKHLQTGYLFKKGSAEEVTEAMLWFAANRPTAVEFANKAYDFAVQHFEQKNIVRQFENYLMSIPYKK